MQNSPARSSIDVGAVIADTYTIEALIGRGGMGAVFLASHKRLPGKQVAIKVLHAELVGEEVLARFKREAEIASRLGHPNIVQVHDFNVMPDGTPYLVLEYLHGESLAQRLKRGPLVLDHTLSIVRQVGSALAAAHREGIVHRDLKPQNIFLVPTEVDGRVVEIAKVLDFGISKIRGSTTVQTQDSALLGTPQYMAPEQALGQHANVDERTDGFAFGVIVYEMLSGQPAFSGQTIPEVVFKVVYEQPLPLAQHVALPESVTAAVHRAIAKDAADRFATVGGFVEALTGQPLAPGRAGPSIPPPDVGFATGSRLPNTGRDAFANTVGSGDHGPPPPKPSVHATAPTVDSQSQQLGTAGTVTAHPPPARSRGTLFLALAVLIAAATAVVVVMMMRDRDDAAKVAEVTDPPAHVADAAETIVPVATPDSAIVAAPDAATIEKVAEIEIPRPPDPAPKENGPAPKDRKPADKKAPATDEEADGDEALAQKLKDANAAFKAGNFSRAEELANAVSNSEDATPQQRMRALMLYGMLQCAAHNDAGRAHAVVRLLGSAPKLRRRVIEACNAKGYLRNVR
jgi:serine/threonine-protein kinase